ncbi:LysR family transcriptional regulator [Paracoccus zhejiangensis]|nr:LysR family transcriptional regulator [Paracoccus zhejiangensis]
MPERLPLNALQAFDHAARCGSFAGAAEELGVSATAISQHVRQLEARFGKELFLRRANGVDLTDAGRELFQRVSGAFAELTEATAHLRHASSRPRLVISVIASVGELWLLPVLARLEGRAGVRIIEESRDPVDFTAEGIDIRITYGATAYPQHAVETLFQDRMLPVAAPALAAQWIGGVEGVPDELLIHTGWGPSYGSAQSWADWHEAMGSGRRPDLGRGMVLDRLAGAAAAARSGLGVALLPETLAAADLARGSLVAAGPAAARMPLPYVMIGRPAPRPRPAAAVWQHLLAEARGVAQALPG